MALGSSYSNQNNNQNSMWEPSYYSRLRIKNPTDNLALNFVFWKGTLKVSIANSNIQDGRNPDLAYIYLSPTKASLLASCVNRIMNNKETDDIFGVDTGVGETRGFIAIGRRQGIPFLFIAKVTPDGKYESSQTFNFNNDYNYLLKVHNLDSLKFQKEYMNNVELLQFYDLLCDYARFASGALGASVHDIGRYETAKITNIVRKIGEKTGAVDFNKKSNNSFFNNTTTDTEYESQSSSKPRYQTIDELESEL